MYTIPCILSLKANQPSLYEDVKLFFEATPPGMEELIQRTVQHSQGHGRVERRECLICEDIEWLSTAKRWPDLKGIGVIRSLVQQKEQTSEQNHYFIYSCKTMSAEQIMAAKRSHWGIENGLHWVLDMAFREDESRARKDYSAENFNVLRHMAYNILNADSSVKGSFSDKQFKCLLDPRYLEKILAAWLCS